MKRFGASQRLDSKTMEVLADLLGESPETTLAVHALRRQFCKAFVAGSFQRFQAAIVQIDFFPTEPQAFGSDPEAIWNLVQLLQGWDCINVNSDVAPAIAQLIEERMNTSVRFYNDVYYTLSKPAVKFENEHVKLLQSADLELLNSAPKELRGQGFGTPQGLLKDGIVACGIISGNIVSITHTVGITRQYADIGVFTHEKWRSYGFATATVSLVAQQLQKKQLIPVWSAGDDNYPSIRIAEKIGFTKVSQRQYIIINKQRLRHREHELR